MLTKRSWHVFLLVLLSLATFTLPTVGLAGSVSSPGYLVPTASSTTQVEPLGYAGGAGYQDMRARNLISGTGALNTGATNGFAYTQAGAGAPVGVPGVLPTGSPPLYVDSTNGAIYAYYGAAWNKVGSGAAGSLQVAYNAGATIATSGAVPVALSDTNNDAGAVLTVNKAPGAANGGAAITATVGVNGSGNGLTITQNGTGVGLSVLTGSNFNSSQATISMLGTFSASAGSVAGFTNTQAFNDNGTGASTTTARFFYLTPTVSFSGVGSTAHYEGITLGVTESALGSGTNYLLRLMAGSAGTTDKFLVDNGGGIITNGVGANGFTLLATMGSSAAQDPSFGQQRARNTTVSPAIVAASDVTGGLLSYGYDGAAYRACTRILSEVDGTPGAGSMPGMILFATTPTGSTTVTSRVRINAAGSVVCNDSTVALATTATDGFVYLGSCAGTPTGVPTAFAGSAPVVIDSTNNLLYFRSGGSWVKSNSVSLSSVLAVGNTTGANDILVSIGQSLTFSTDVQLTRQNAAGRLGLFQNTSGGAAALRVYATTDSTTTPTNADWLEITTVAGGAKTISTNKAGTGTAGNLILATGGTTALTIDSAQVATFAAGVTGTTITGSSTITAGAGSSFAWSGRSKVDSGSDGVITIRNTGNTGFTSLNLGPSASGTDTAGMTPIILVGAGTGAGANGTLRLQAAPAVSGGASGSGVNAQTTLLTLAAVQNNLSSAAFSNGALCEVANVTFGDGAGAGTGSFCGVRIAPTLNYTNGTKAQNFTALLIQQTNTSAPTGTLNLIDAQVGGASQFKCSSGGNGTFAGSLTVNNGGSFAVQLITQGTVPLKLGGLTTIYNNVTTAGYGQPAIYAYGDTAAATGQTTSAAAYTVGAADGTFQINCNILVTTATTHSFTAEVAYTDEGNTARVLTLSYTLLAGGTLGTLVVNANGTVPYEYVPVTIRAKASTSITVRTNAAGTYTSVVYNMRAAILQIG